MNLNVGMLEQNNEWLYFCKAVLFKPKFVELFGKLDTCLYLIDYEMYC